MLLAINSNYVINSYDPKYGVYLGDFSNLGEGEVSGKVFAINDTSIQVINCTYNGNAPDLYFWLDHAETPTRNGLKIPTYEYSIAELGPYKDSKRVVLNLPSKHKIVNFKSLSFYSNILDKNYGSVLIPDALSPPKPQFIEKQLKGSRYSLSSGPILIKDRRTVKIFAFTFDADKAPDGYFFAGKGPNVAAKSGIKLPIRGRDTNDSVVAMNERYRGGKDIYLDLPEDYDITNIDWLSVYIFKFNVDLAHVAITNISQKIPPFVPVQASAIEVDQAKVWKLTTLLGTSSRRNFTFQLGPPGGLYGYSGSSGHRAGKSVWYVNGYLADIYLKRGETYTFTVEGGDDKSDKYNPLYISNDEFGGYAKLSNEEKALVTIIEGGEHTAGRLCEWTQSKEQDKPENYDSFSAYKQTLKLSCNTVSLPSSFNFTPTKNTSDIVYFQSYYNYNMGNKIYIVDEIPESMEDIHEEPYEHEAWLEQQNVRKSPRKVNSAPAISSKFSIATLAILLMSIIFYL
uniref:Protein Skeletor n=1 Tax=Rhabditophanes sp. KR3021 TaxID=114890 RepID=A0AC35U4I0_9BILA